MPQQAAPNQTELERATRIAERALQQGDMDTFREMKSLVEELETADRAPRFGEGRRMPSGELNLGILPGISARVSPEGQRSIEVNAPPFFEQPTYAGAARVGMRAGREALEGLRGIEAITPGGMVRRGIQSAMGRQEQALPEVPVNPGEAAAAAALQYGTPGVGAGRVAMGALRQAPGFLRMVGGLVSTAAADFAVTNPENAVTFGDAIGGPTAIEEDDTALARRFKVAGEGALAGAGLGALIAGARGLWSVGGRVISNKAEANSLARETVRRALIMGQLEGAGQPVNEATDALAELVEARRLYTNEGLEAVPQHMRKYVANQIQVSPADYLADRGINYGPRAAEMTVGTEPVIVNQRESNVGALRRATAERAGSGQGDVELPRATAERRVEAAEAGAAGARETMDEELQRVYQQVEGAMERASTQADAAAAAARGLLDEADELRAAGRIDEAVRAEREAANTYRDTLYGAIDPKGRVRLNPRTLRSAYATLLDDVVPSEIRGWSVIQRRIDRAFENPGAFSYRDVNGIITRLNRIIDSAVKQNDFSAQPLIQFRNTIRDRYFDELAKADETAAAIAQAARAFMRDELAPRFRQLGGGTADQRIRGGNAGSRQITGDFINTGPTLAEDANILNRILRGLRVDDATVARILKSAGVTPPVGEANIVSRTAAQHQQGLGDVSELMVGMLARQMGENPSALRVRNFIRRYNDAIEQFDADSPIVRQRLEEIAEQLETAETRGKAAQALQQAARTIGNVTDSLTDVSPQRAYAAISRAALKASEMNFDAALAAATVARRAEEQAEQVGQQALVRYFRGNDPATAIQRLLSSHDPAGEIRQILQELEGVLGAENALKAAMAQHILRRVQAASIDGIPRIRATLQQLNQFYSDPKVNRALTALYGREWMEGMEVIQDQLRMADISEARLNPNLMNSLVGPQMRNQLQDLFVNVSGATEGLKGRAQSRSRVLIIKQVRNWLSGGQSTEQLYNTRLAEALTNPEVMASMVRGMSEDQALRLMYIYMAGGSRAYLAALNALREPQGAEDE